MIQNFAVIIVFFTVSFLVLKYRKSIAKAQMDLHGEIGKSVGYKAHEFGFMAMGVILGVGGLFATVFTLFEFSK